MKTYNVDKYTKTTTVGELIKELQKYDENLFVFSEGCDCTGNVVDVIIDTDGSILLRRDDE